MSQDPGGFFMPGLQQQQGGYPPQQGAQGGGLNYPSMTGSPYPPQNLDYPVQQPDYNSQQQVYPPQQVGYAQQPAASGYPPQQIPFAGAPQQGGGIYPPISGNALPYGLGPGIPPPHQSGYPLSGSGFPPQQPCAYPMQYPAQQGVFPPSSGNMHYPPVGSGHLANSSNWEQANMGHPRSTNGIELSISCTNLRDEDVFSKSDPVCVLFERRTASGAWTEVGRTETIKDSHHPKWQKKFVLQYNPQITQELKFEIYDWDSKSQKLNRHDPLGLVEVSLGTIISSPGKQLTASLKRGGGGRITIMAEEVSAARQIVKLQLMAHKLDKKDTFGKSDPYFNLNKKMPSGQWSLVYKSEVIKNNSNPKWSPMQKPITEVCNGDYDRELKIEVFDYDSSGENDLIGEFTTSLRSLSSGVNNQTQYEVIHPQKQRNKRHYQNSGVVSVGQFYSQ